MKKSSTLAVDPSSPEASVEDLFFRKGIEEDGKPRQDPEPLMETRRSFDLGALKLWGGGLLAALCIIGLARWTLRGSDQRVEPPRAVIAAAPAAVRAMPPAPPKAVAPAAPTPPATPPATPSPKAEPANPSGPAPEQTCREALAGRRFDDALAMCPRAIAAQPRPAELAFLLAEAALERGRPRDAVDWAQRAVASDPGLAEAYVLIGGAEQESGHRAEARAAYAKYLELAPRGRHARDLRIILRGL